MKRCSTDARIISAFSTRYLVEEAAAFHFYETDSRSPPNQLDDLGARLGT
jgi:hypothetical protein